MAVQVSLRDVTRIRLSSQLLDQSATGTSRTPADVVERLLAMQAQDLPSALWAIGVRSPGLGKADVERAINEGSILRSWPMRGTLHFVPPQDLRWMLGLTSPRLLAGMATRYAQLGIDDAVIEQALGIVRPALEGGRGLRRAAIFALLNEYGIATGNQRGAQLIAHLCLTGVLCWGPMDGTVQTLVLLDEWVPTPRVLEREEALGEFVLRYFQGHGPSTLKDFAWWSQLTLADARVGLEVARDQLVEFEVDGVSHFLPASSDTGEWGAAPLQRSPILALGAFDEILLGYTNRRAAITDPDLLQVVPGKNGLFLPLILARGRVVGTWRRLKTGSEVTAEAQPFRGWSARQAASWRRSIRDYERFLGTPVRVIGDRHAGEAVTQH